ncbi:phosphotransferase [Candidatus Vidania fulgoroideorum]
MAVYTKVNKKLVKIIKKNYFKFQYFEIKGIKKGSENSNFFINKKYILTIVENIKKLKTFFEKINVINILYYKNLKTPKIMLDKKGKNFFLYKKKFSLITKRIKGKSLKYPRKISCFYLGKLISKIHNLNDFYYILNNNFFNFNKIIKYFYKNIKLFKNDNFILKEFIFIKKINLNIPFGFNHCDIFKDNVFFKNYKISGILDFYFSGLEFFLFDISIFIIDWCFNEKKFIKNNLKYFLLSYNFYRKIKKKEIKYIIIFLKIVSIRFMITRKINNKMGKKYKNPYFFKKILFFLKKKKNFLIKKIIKILNDKKFYNKKNK